MLPADGLGRLAAALGSVNVRTDRRLGGGIASITHQVTSAAGTADERRLVLKLFPLDEAESARLEWERMTYAVRAPVPTPQPIALDLSGQWFGTPALVMNALPGESHPYPDDVKSWTQQLGQALAAIHTTPVDQPVPPALRQAHLWERWQPWTAGDDARINAATSVIRVLQQRAPLLPVVFCHADYHPGNVLFERGRLSGVVDWNAAKLAPAAADVAQCRVDLALHPGGDAPDLFLDAYRRASGTALDELPAWDVLLGVHALQWAPTWLGAFADVGVHLTPEKVCHASEAFVDGALARG